MTVESAPDDLVGAYKKVLREVLERRPSGMRQRLAEALGTTRSFVSQITNPSYATPIPAQYIATVFEICHFSEGERSRFLAAYRKAHPRRGGSLDAPVEAERTLSVTVPDLGSDALNAEFDSLVLEAVQRMRRLVDMKEK
jgi:hypothetical protein